MNLKRYEFFADEKELDFHFVGFINNKWLPFSNKVKHYKISIFEKRADESVKFLEKVGFPEEFKKKK